MIDEQDAAKAFLAFLVFCVLVGISVWEFLKFVASHITFGWRP